MRCFEFLVGGLELLAHRHSFFVDRPYLFLGDFTIADGGLEIPAGGFQFLLDPSHPRRLGRRLSLDFRRGPGLRQVDEAQEDQVPAAARQQPRGDAHRDRRAIALYPPRDGRLVLPLGHLLDHRSDRGAQPLPRRGEHVEAGLAARHLQVEIGWADVVEPLMPSVH